MSPAPLRPVLAILLLVGFLARSSGLELAHRCPAPTAGAHSAGADRRDHEHHPLPGIPDRCECVGQSCGTSVLLPGTRSKLAPGHILATFHGTPRAGSPNRPSIPHLLPFAQGPPA